MKLQFKKVNQVCKFIKGKKPKVLGEQSKKNKIPYINIKAFETGVVDEYAEEGAYTTCNTNDVLIVWDGSRSGFVGMGRNGYVGSTLAKVQCKDFDNKFLYYFFLYLYPEINSRAKGVGIPHVDPQILGNKEIPLMDKEAQIHVVAKIDSLFSKIDASAEELQKTKEKLELYKQSVLNAAIRGKLVSQDPKVEPASELLVRIRAKKEKLIKEGKIKKEKPLPPIDQSEIQFELPKGWEWVRLIDIMEIITKGSSPNWQGVKYVSKNEGIAFITSKNVQKFYIEYQNLEYVEKKFNEIEPRSILKAGDVLTNIVGASIGRTAIFQDSFIANINQAVCILRPIDLAFSKWIELYLNSPMALEMMNTDKVEMARANLGMSEIAKFLIPFPAISVQQKILKHANKLIEEATEQQQIAQKLIDLFMLLKQSILKQAFEGKLI
jgi:restriction endonuclease S subunit